MRYKLSLADYVKGKQNLRNLEKFWGGLNGEILLIIPRRSVSEIRNIKFETGGAQTSDCREERAWVTFDGDLKALEFVQRVLLLLNKSSQIKVVAADDIDLAKVKDCNLVIFCGPLGNEATKKLVEMGAVDKWFTDKYELVYDGEKFQSGVDRRSDKKYVDDFSLICKQPWGNGKTLVLLAGCRTYGTQAAAAISTIGKAIGEVDSKYPNCDFTNLAMVCKIWPAGDENKNNTGEKELTQLKSGDESNVRIVKPFESAIYNNPTDVVDTAVRADLAKRINLNSIITCVGLFGGICLITAGLVTNTWTCTGIGLLLFAGTFLHLLTEKY